MNQKPNILIIVTDQEYAHQALPDGVPLPNRDRLHNRGVTFNNHQCTTTRLHAVTFGDVDRPAHVLHPHDRQHQFSLDRGYTRRSGNLADHWAYVAGPGLLHGLQG